MIARNQLQTGVLAITWLGITMLTIYAWFSPTASKREVKAFSFPTQIFLDSWQLVKTKSLPLDKLKTIPQEDLSEANLLGDRILAARQYNYLYDGIPLEIQMRYIVGTRGNVLQLINRQTDLSGSILDQTELKKIPQVGYHLFYRDRDKAYFSTCINSRGYTTATAEQFSQNRYRQIKPDLVLSWLQGKDSFRDLRCLWIQISIPIQESSLKNTNQILTKAWIDWYSWWQPRFPSL